MATAITFDGNNLQTATVTTSDIDHETIPSKNANTYALAHGNRSVLPFINYPSRQITIKGNIKGATVAACDAAVDAFKAYFNTKEGNLDIGYNATTRRYIATAIGIQVDPGRGLTVREFTVVFVCTYPFGMNTANTTLINASGNTSGATNFAPTFIGTAPFQLPIITLTYSATTSSSANAVTNPGLEVDTTGYSTAGTIGTFSRVTTQNHSGVAAGQMVNAASAPLSVPSANTYGWVIYSLTGLVPGQQYTLSMWVKGNAGGELFKMSTLLSSVGSATLTTSWQLVSLTFTATNSTDQIYIWSNTASATWFIDDLSVIPSIPAYVTVTNHANGQGILLFSNPILAGDVIVMDSTTRKVTQNGVEIDFTGSFIELAAQVAQFDYADGLLTRTFNITIAYNPLYL